jgi:hypothetical protein
MEPLSEREEWEIFAPFLAFLDEQMAKRPELIRPLDETVLKRARELVKDVPPCHDETLPDDFTL